MIISPSRRFIFVHIPKTGGTSLALALESRARADDILIGDTLKARRRSRRQAALVAPGRLWKHARLADIDGMEGLEPLTDYFVFTLVRDPWDRVLSLYHWLRVQSFDHMAVNVAKCSDFSGFLADPQVAAMLAADGSAGYVTDRSGRLRCDAFVRLERLGEDLGPVTERLGFSLLPLPHANRSDRPADSRAQYCARDAERVAGWFADDIRRFGYAF